MSNIFILLILAGALMFAWGMDVNLPRSLYCEELGYKASLKDWQSYAAAQVTDKVAKKEFKLMTQDRFIEEFALIFGLHLKEVI